MYWTGSLVNQSKKYSTITSSQTFASSIDKKQLNLPLIRNRYQQKPEDRDMQDKVNQIMLINKRHEQDEVCVCQDCIYMKQIYRNPQLRLQLSKKSSYRQQYKKNIPIFKTLNKSLDMSGSKANLEGSAVKSKYVQINSNYNKNYLNRSLQKVYKPKPQDQLRFQGPISNASSYLSQFPNLKGPYQYLQPLKQDPLIKKRFDSKSLYSSCFNQKDLKPTQSGKMADSLKLGKQSFVKESTNKSNFFIPNPEAYSNSKRQEQKRIQPLNDKHQYETTARNQYEKHQKANCRTKRMFLQNINKTRSISSQMNTIS